MRLIATRDTIETDSQNPITNRNIILATILGGILGILLIMAILLGFWVRHRKRFPAKGDATNKANSTYSHYAASRTPTPVLFPPPLLEQQQVLPKPPSKTRFSSPAKKSPDKKSPEKLRPKSSNPRKSVSSSIYIQSRPLPGTPRQAPPVPRSEPFMKDPLSHSFVSAANQKAPPTAPPSLVLSLPKRTSSSNTSILKNGHPQTLKQSLNSVIHESLDEELPRDLPSLSPCEMKDHSVDPPRNSVSEAPKPSQSNMGKKLRALLHLSGGKKNPPEPLEPPVTSGRRISLPSPEFKKTWTTYDPAPKIDLTLDGASSIYLPNTSSSSTLGSRCRTPVQVTHAATVAAPLTPQDKIITTPPVPSAPRQNPVRASSESEGTPPTLPSSSTHDTRGLQPTSSNGGTVATMATEGASMQSLLGTRLSVCIESGLSWLSEFHKFDSMGSRVPTPHHTPKASPAPYQLNAPEIPEKPFVYIPNVPFNDTRILPPERSSQRESRARLNPPSTATGINMGPIAVPPKASARLPSLRISHIYSEPDASQPRFSITEAPPPIGSNGANVLSPRYGHTRIDSVQTYVEDHRAYANQPEDYKIPPMPSGTLAVPQGTMSTFIPSVGVHANARPAPGTLVEGDCDFDFDQGRPYEVQQHFIGVPATTGTFVQNSRPISISSSVFNDDYTGDNTGPTFEELQRQYRESGINLRYNGAMDYVRETEELLESLRTNREDGMDSHPRARGLQSYASSDTLRLGPIPSNSDVRPLRISKQPSRGVSLQQARPF